MDPDLWTAFLNGITPNQVPAQMAQNWNVPTAAGQTGMPPTPDYNPAVTAGLNAQYPWGDFAPPAQPPGGGTPMPTGQPVGAMAPVTAPPGAASASAPEAKAAPGVGGLAAALKGVAPPTQPRPQTVHTPAAPRPTGHIQGGLTEFLQKVGLLRGAQMPSSYQLPSTLGAALGGGR